MKKDLQTKFSTRQYMISKDFEIYYYNDHNLSKVKNHKHSYYEFFFFISGDVSIVIQNKQYKLKCGDIILIPKNVNHYSIIHTHEVPYRRFVLWISDNFYERLLKDSPNYGYILNIVYLKNNYIFHNDIINFNEIQAKVFKLIEEIHSKKFGRTEQILLCVKSLLLHLNRIAYQKNNPTNLKEGYSLYQNLINYIEENLEGDLSLERLAKEFHVSKYHIAHVFKNNIGVSTHQYITKKRLECCRSAILNNLKMCEVYLRFGFKDYSNFYRAFKNEYGISPLKFKNSHLKSF